jgi:hypothetical protein
MRPRELHIPTTWRVKGRAEDVYEILTTPQDFVRWWPAVYLDVKEVRAGDAHGSGRIVSLVTKGKLPYKLRWQAEVIEAEKPHRMLIHARGDLSGRGEWRFRQDGEITEVRYDWTVLAAKPWMIYLAPLLNPVFVANHLWAMQRGLEGLERELSKRR